MEGSDLNSDIEEFAGFHTLSGHHVGVLSLDFYKKCTSSERYGTLQKEIESADKIYNAKPKRV